MNNFVRSLILALMSMAASFASQAMSPTEAFAGGAFAQKACEQEEVQLVGSTGACSERKSEVPAAPALDARSVKLAGLVATCGALLANPELASPSEVKAWFQASADNKKIAKRMVAERFAFSRSSNLVELQAGEVMHQILVLKQYLMQLVEEKEGFRGWAYCQLTLAEQAAVRCQIQRKVTEAELAQSAAQISQTVVQPQVVVSAGQASQLTRKAPSRMRQMCAFMNDFIPMAAQVAIQLGLCEYLGLPPEACELARGYGQYLGMVSAVGGSALGWLKKKVWG